MAIPPTTKAAIFSGVNPVLEHNYHDDQNRVINVQINRYLSREPYIPSFRNVCLHELSFLRDGIYKLPVKVYTHIFSLSSFLMAPLNNSGMDLPISPNTTNKKYSASIINACLC